MTSRFDNRDLLYEFEQFTAGREALYSEYRSHGSTGEEGRHEHLRRLLGPHVSQVPRGMPVIDLGCGTGLALDVMREMGFAELSGCDIASDPVTHARARGFSVEQEDLFTALQRRGVEVLGAVISFDVLEHLTRAELVRVRSEVHRVLRPGGIWLIHVPNALSPFFGAIRHGDLTHQCAFTPSSMDQLLAPMGFEVRCFDDGPTARSLTSAARWLAWQGVRFGISAVHGIETGVFRHSALTRNMLVVARKR